METETAYAGEEHQSSPTLLDLLLALIEHWRFIVLTPLACAAVAYIVTFLIAPTYVATTRLLPPIQQQGSSGMLSAQLGALAGLVGGVPGVKNLGDQYVALLKSRSIADAIITRFSLKDAYGERFMQDARKELERRTRITSGSRDGLITIEVDDEDATRAAHIANAFVQELRDLSKTLAITEAAQRRLFFESQLAQVKENLANSEATLRRSGVSEASLKTVPQTALESLARIKAEITAQEIKLASMRTFMTESNPDFRLALQQLVALRAELGKAEQTTSLRGAGGGADYVAKYRDFKYHETLFELLAKQYEIARLDEAREGALIQVVDIALPPELKTRPKRLFIAAVIGFMVAALVISVVLIRVRLRGMSRHPIEGQKIRAIRTRLSFRSK